MGSLSKMTGTSSSPYDVSDFPNDASPRMWLSTEP